jgi:adenylate cyclase
VTAINLPNGRHAFDLVDPDETSRDVVRATLAFLRANLSAESQSGHRARAEQRRAVDRHAARDWEGTLAATAAWREREPEAAQAFHLAGDALYQLRRYRDAAESYDRAGTLRWYPFITLYNAGCSWALAGDRERALGALERAVATGFYQDRRAIANDPDLISVRDDPRFRKLVEGP